MLDNDLSVNEEMASLSTKSGPISVKSRVGIGLILCSGGRVIEAMRRSFVALNFKKFVRAVNRHPSLAIKFDKSRNNLLQMATEFKNKSDFQLFQYCVGCIDGLAIKIKTLKKSEVLNTARFMSGSKKKMCMNMQGVCDARTRFIAVTMKHVGCTNDSEAFQTSSLSTTCNSLPFPYHWNGDNAYTLSQTMMIPFPGKNLNVIAPYQEAFNFYHSQIRIHIERCFGIFVRRWGILWKALEYDLSFQFEIVHCLCRLHNYCIDNNMPIINDNRNIPAGAALDDDGVLVDPFWRDVSSSDLGSTAAAGNAVRDRIVQTLEMNAITRTRNHNLH
jgi:hypothetical protein